MDHIFIDLSLSNTDITKGKITAVAAVRTDGKGNVLTSFSEEVDPGQFDNTADNLLSVVLAPNFIKEYVIVAAYADIDRQFLKAAWRGIDLRRWISQGHIIEPFQGRSWIDILQLAWPLVYNNRISDRSFDTVCKHFDIQNIDSETAMGNCEALVRCYWRLMHQYKIALYGEGLIRDIGGKGYSTLVSFFK